MVFTTAGKNLIRDWLAGNSPTPPTHIGFGDDNTSATINDTSLGNELVRKSISDTSTTDQRVKFTALLTSVEQNGEVIREIGLFNASTSGTMLQRCTFADINKTSSIELEVEVYIKIE